MTVGRRQRKTEEKFEELNEVNRWGRRPNFGSTPLDSEGASFEYSTPANASSQSPTFVEDTTHTGPSQDGDHGRQGMYLLQECGLPLLMARFPQIKGIEEEMAKTQKNKATSYHLGQLKAKLAKLKRELLTPSSSGGGGGCESVQAFQEDTDV